MYLALDTGPAPKAALKVERRNVRFITPDNILLRRDGTVKVLGFSLTKLISSQSTTHHL